MPLVFPLIDPFGARVEVVGSVRKDVLLGRGWTEEAKPVPPSPSPSEVGITADVVLAPWDARRVANIERYEIPDLNVVSDTDRKGCWPTVREAWEHGVAARGTHHLVLTDDLTLTQGFWDALNECVGLFSDSPISLFSVKKGALFASQEGRRWCVSWGCTGAANVLPTHLIEPFLEWEQRRIKPDCPHDDVRLTAWATEKRIGVLTPVPCLVEHGMFPSVIGDSPLFGRTHSQAAVFQPDVRGLDWTQGADNPAFIGISVDRPGSWLLDGKTLADLRN